jgi:hypothetical protein
MSHVGREVHIQRRIEITDCLRLAALNRIGLNKEWNHGTCTKRRC